MTLGQLASFVSWGGPAVETTLGIGCNSDGDRWSTWVGVPQPGDGGVAARRALIKARIKCRDAGLLGRPFPGEAFARLDPEGAGRVPRPSFKRALREMGFALVDETPEKNREGLLGGDAQWSDTKKERGVGASEGCPLGDLVEEEHAKDDEEIRLRRVEGDEEEEARRKMFRDKVEEIEKSVAEKVSLRNTILKDVGV